MNTGKQKLKRKPSDKKDEIKRKVVFDGAIPIASNSKQEIPKKFSLNQVGGSQSHKSNSTRKFSAFLKNANRKSPNGEKPENEFERSLTSLSAKQKDVKEQKRKQAKISIGSIVSARSLSLHTLDIKKLSNASSILSGKLINPSFEKTQDSVFRHSKNGSTNQQRFSTGIQRSSVSKPDEIMQFYKGSFSNLPPVNSRTVRIFVSSTFSGIFREKFNIPVSLHINLTFVRFSKYYN